MAADRPAEVTNRAAITVCVILATIMQALDTTIANIALPYIQGSVSASQDQINWVLTSYIVAAAIMTPPTGFLAGRFGRKRLFLASVVGFTVASMLCGMAQSLVQIVLFRILQGMFGAALVPLSQAVLFDTYSPERRGFAMALHPVDLILAGRDAALNVRQRDVGDRRVERLHDGGEDHADGDRRPVASGWRALRRHHDPDGA